MYVFASLQCKFTPVSVKAAAVISSISRKLLFDLLGYK
jgi:hypothetical protein